nr:hypothetical protein [Shuttle vector pG108]AVN57622.1 hypothetical protein [Shuttle vector pG106]UTD45291.1 LacOPZ [Shuttle vector pG106-KA]
MRCEIPHRCVRRKYRIRRHSPFRLRNCWEGRSVRASSLLRQLAKGGCAARRLSWVTPGFSQSRRCKTTASEFELGTRGSSRVDLQACKLGVIMVIAVSCVKLLSAHNSTQHTSRKHKV